MHLGHRLIAASCEKYPYWWVPWFWRENSNLSSRKQGSFLAHPNSFPGLPRGLSGKESTYQCRRPSLIPGSGRFPRKGNGNPLQYSCLGNPVDRGAWPATIHGVARIRGDLATKQQKSVFPSLQDPRKSRLSPQTHSWRDWGPATGSPGFIRAGHQLQQSVVPQTLQQWPPWARAGPLPSYRHNHSHQ